MYQQMKIVKGNLINMFENGDFDVIIHGCNCFHTMGAGIALQLAQRYPEVLRADVDQSVFGDKTKLGGFSMATIPRKGKQPQFILNAYTQFSTGGKRAVSYDAIADFFERFGSTISNGNFKIGYPMIGAGLAGGDWDVIKVIIDKALDGCDHTLVEWDGT